MASKQVDRERAVLVSAAVIRAAKRRRPSAGGFRLLRLVVSVLAMAGCHGASTSPSGSKRTGDDWTELRWGDYRKSGEPAPPSGLLARVQADLARTGAKRPVAAHLDAEPAVSIALRDYNGSAAIACYGDRLAAWGGGMPGIWRLGDPTITELEAPEGAQWHVSKCMAWSADGSQLVSVGSRVPVHEGEPIAQPIAVRWDAATGHVVETKELAPGWDGTSCSISAAADVLAAPSDRFVGLWDLRSGAKLRGTASLDLSFGLDFSPDGRKLAVATIAGLRIFGVPGLKPLAGSKQLWSGAHRTVRWASDQEVLTAWSSWEQTLVETWTPSTKLTKRETLPAAGALLAVRRPTLLFSGGWAVAAQNELDWHSLPVQYGRGGCFLREGRIVARVGGSARIGLGRIGSTRGIDVLFLAGAPAAISPEDVVDANGDQLDALRARSAVPPYGDIAVGELRRDPKLLENWLREAVP